MGYKCRGVAILLVAASLGACSSGGGDPAAFCPAVEEFAQTEAETEDAVAEIEAGITTAQEVVERKTAVYEKLVEEAPDDIAKDLRTLDRLTEDSHKISEQEQYEEAQSRVNEYIRKTCDLDITL